MAASGMIPSEKPYSIGSLVPPAIDPSYSHQFGSLENVFELEESEVWTSISYQAAPSPNTSRKVDRPKKLFQPRKPSNAVVGAAASSLPVNIPDWSKILKDGYDNRDRLHRWDGEGEYDESDHDGADQRLPPHEYLARRRGASLSVHEGVGRTLKGRDLRRVRNDVWKKVGFED